MINEKRQIPTTQELNLGTVSTATEALVNAGSVSLSAGVYAIQYNVAFTANATGYRAIGINTTSTPTDISAHGYRFATRINAVDGGQTVVTFTALDKLSSASTTFYFHVQQNSGSTLNCYPRIFIVKLA